MKHASFYNHADVEIEYINAVDVESPEANLDEIFKGIDGILIPGGFGDRGIEGMIRSAQYAREHKIPFFGICLGMQCAVIEYARNVCGMKKANSTEFDEATPYPVIYLMPEQMSVEIKGGTMRLGKYPVSSLPAAMPKKLMEPTSSANAIVIAMKSTTTLRKNSSPMDWFRLGRCLTAN